VDAPGGPEVLKIANVPTPVPGPHEVVLQVKAIGVNYGDVKMRRGDFPSPDGKAPFFPGAEVAGHIVYRGEGARDFGESEKLVALPPKGAGYAEMVVCPISRVFRVPERFSWEEAAAYPMNFLTAWFALRAGRTQAVAETVLIHAAGGGVGTAAVQLAAYRGSRVIATAGDDRKLEAVTRLGAHVTCNYKDADFRDTVREATEGRGVDLVLDSVGGRVFEASLEVLAPFGRLVTYGAASGHEVHVDPASLLDRNLSVVGLNTDGFIRRPGVARETLEELARIHAETNMRPVVGRVLPLDQAAEAHRLLEGRRTFGKIVLTV
jgi:NADPH:quinone reductase